MKKINFLRKRRFEMFKFFVNLAYFSKAVQNAFCMFFLKPVKQIHNEEQETDKQKFARIPIGIYPLQYLVTTFQRVFDGQLTEREVLNDILDAMKNQNQAILRLIKVHIQKVVDKKKRK